MWEVIIIILGIFIIVNAFMWNIIAGIIALVLLLLYFYYKRYTAMCVAFALRNFKKGNMDKAFTWFDRGYRHGMTTHQITTYGYYLLRAGRTEKSEQIFNALLRKSSLKKEARFEAKANHAVLLLKTGRLQESIEEMEEIFPYYKNTSLYGSLGYAYILSDDTEKAKAFNEEAYQYNSDNTVILDNMVQLNIRLENYEEAENYGLKLLEKKPYFIEAYYDTGYAEYKLGKKEEAKAHLEEALNCQTSFMSTVTYEDVKILLDALESGDNTIEHKLGKFTRREVIPSAGGTKPVEEKKEPETMPERAANGNVYGLPTDDEFDPFL